MKQTLQLKLGQHLTMTPQLQQAIRLLQLSTMELQTEVQQALDSNMMLEVPDGDDGEAAGSSDSNTQSATGSEAETPSASAGESDLDMASESLPDDLPVDTVWDDVYEATAPPASLSTPAPDTDFDYQGASTENLKDHLLWQMELTRFSDLDKAMARAIIEDIDADGYFHGDLDDIRSGVEVDADNPVDLTEVEAVLRRVQAFDPPGVGGRDLGECLTIQLNQLPLDTGERDLALELVRDHLDQLGGRDINSLRKALKTTEEALVSAIHLVRSLNPRPGSVIEDEAPEYIIPDVFVAKKNGAWKVELNPDIVPKVRINPYYASLIKRADNSADNNAMKTHLQEARWFLKSLHSRSDTLLRVASAIVAKQEQFLEYGPEAMRPMVLHDIADAVSMHESTISRVTTRKFMHTPRGIFELKYFFSSHVATDSGGEASSTAIRALIKKLVEAENPGKPLSDSKIATILSSEGIKVARRTVAKYREAMLIPSSTERKRLV